MLVVYVGMKRVVVWGEVGGQGAQLKQEQTKAVGLGFLAVHA